MPVVMEKHALSADQARELAAYCNLAFDTDTFAESDFRKATFSLAGDGSVLVHLEDAVVAGLPFEALTGGVP